MDVSKMLREVASKVNIDPKRSKLKQVNIRVSDVEYEMWNTIRQSMKSIGLDHNNLFIQSIPLWHSKICNNLIQIDKPSVNEEIMNCNKNDTSDISNKIDTEILVTEMIPVEQMTTPFNEEAYNDNKYRYTEFFESFEHPNLHNIKKIRGLYEKWVVYRRDKGILNVFMVKSNEDSSKVPLKNDDLLVIVDNDDVQSNFNTISTWLDQMEA